MLIEANKRRSILTHHSTFRDNYLCCLSRWRAGNNCLLNYLALVYSGGWFYAIDLGVPVFFREGSVAFLYYLLESLVVIRGYSFGA